MGVRSLAMRAFLSVAILLGLSVAAPWSTHEPLIAAPPANNSSVNIFSIGQPGDGETLSAIAVVGVRQTFAGATKARLYVGNVLVCAQQSPGEEFTFSFDCTAFTGSSSTLVVEIVGPNGMVLGTAVAQHTFVAPAPASTSGQNASGSSGSLSSP